MKRREIEQLTENIRIDRAAIDHARILSDAGAALESSTRPAAAESRPWEMNGVPRLVWITGLVAGLLIVVSGLACLLLYKNTVYLQRELAQAQHDFAAAQQDAAIAATDHSTTVNLYLREHQGAVARTAALDVCPPPSARIQVNLRDILYYEYFDGEPGLTQPGIIIRRPSSQQQIDSSETPAIANGHTLTLAEARKTSTFAVKVPPRIYPGYRLEEISRIEGRDALHLVYTNGISRLSLFEQHVDGNRRLGAQDFREYAVYLNQGQGGSAILAWKDDALSYVLIGTHEMSLLMDIAQSISAEDERE